MSYWYQHVTLVSVVDGDTVRLDIDLGNSMWWTGNFRLNGIDTPERGQPGNLEATERLRDILDSGISRIETHKPDKYGRWLVDLFVAVSGGELHVNRMLVTEGHAKEYFGGKKA